MHSCKDRADELYGEHTLLGHVMGDIVYGTYSKRSSFVSLLDLPDVMKIGEMGAHASRHGRPSFDCDA